MFFDISSLLYIVNLFEDASADCGDGTSIAGDSVVSESSLASSRFTGY